MTKCVLIVQLKIPKISQNLFCPSAQIDQLHVWDIFEKKLLSHVHCPWRGARQESVTLMA